MSCDFQPDDLFLHQQVTDLDASAASACAVCAVESVNRAADGYRSTLWVLPFDARRPPWPLTAGLALDNQPRWSPDGQQIAFLSDRTGGRPQVQVIRVDGGEARGLTAFTQGVTDLQWRPDGRALLVTVSVPVDPEARGERRPLPDAPRDPTAPELVWRLPYKLDGLGYTLDREKHLFVVDAATGEERRLTDGSFEVRSSAWSPDGQRIAYARTRERAAHCTDLWLMNADGSGARRLSTDQPTASSPSWSPDGRTIVFAGACDEGDAQMRLWQVDVERGRVDPLGDESIEVVASTSPCWSPDGRRLALVLARRGRQQVCEVAVPEGHVRPITEGDRHVSLLAATPEHLVFTSASPSEAETVRLTDASGVGERELGSFNPWWGERRAPVLQRRRFEVHDGAGGVETIEGWLLRPPGASGPTPLLVDVHGGPASYVLLAYRSHAYWPVLCARGWSVLALDAVGSSSYGRDFAARLRGRWGELDLPQHLEAVRALQGEGLADARVAIAGKSYGGYLSAWSLGHTDLFRCAVVCAPVTNLETHYGTSDSGYYADPYAMNGEPFIDRDTSRRLSPMRHAQRARAPTLILQGKDDERCPKCQAEELYVTIARAGPTPCELVLYPGGSHHLFEDGRPSHRLDAIERLVGWLQRWVDTPLAAPPDEAASAPNGRSDGGDDARSAP